VSHQKAPESEKVKNSRLRKRAVYGHQQVDQKRLRASHNLLEKQSPEAKMRVARGTSQAAHSLRERDAGQAAIAYPTGCRYSTLAGWPSGFEPGPCARGTHAVAAGISFLFLLTQK
jgi:hypothetical protein